VTQSYYRHGNAASTKYEINCFCFENIAAVAPATELHDCTALEVVLSFPLRELSNAGVTKDEASLPHPNFTQSI